jgi:hypothetical protein
MPGTELLGLLDKAQLLTRHDLPNLFRLMTYNNHHLIRCQQPAAIDDMLQQRPTGKGVDNLGARRFHPRSLACGKNDDAQRHIKDSEV